MGKRGKACQQLAYKRPRNRAKRNTSHTVKKALQLNLDWALWAIVLPVPPESRPLLPTMACKGLQHPSAKATGIERYRRPSRKRIPCDMGSGDLGGGTVLSSSGSGFEYLVSHTAPKLASRVPCVCLAAVIVVRDHAARVP